MADVKKPLMLLIRDGWGIGADYDGNAVLAARTPNMDRISGQYPNCTLDASGEPVGVRAGSQGSSEVGHLNMGAGRIVEQEIVRVDKMIRSGELFKVPRLLEAVQQCKSQGKTFHLMGLVQDQGVHATQDHLFAFLDFLAAEGVKDVAVHFFGDGRDTPPQSALKFLDILEEKIAAAGVGKIATVMGRYWAMDRAENWDRTEKAYRLLTEGKGLTAPSARTAIEEAYRRAEQQRLDDEDIAETDEFIAPTAVVDDTGKPVAKIEPGDAVLHFNYRQDRALQLTEAFVEEDFDGFNRGPLPDVFYMGLTRYYDEFPYALVPPMNMANLLGEVLSVNSLRQLRIAEFQKYKHVTSFFNGKMLEPYAGEDRILVDSITIPENQKPEMSAYEVTDMVLTAVSDGVAAARQAAETTDKVSLVTKDFPTGGDLSGTYDVIVLNFANCDMVGHTGVFDAAVKAVETVDECLGKVVEAVLARDGMVLITADHGNAEQMTDPQTGDIHTAHTTNPVEFALVGKNAGDYKLIDHGKLSDIAPTMLQLLGIDIPKEMTAQSLIQ
ncbi:MAG: 2,3-bisphosphoglycerate-independent phosphoglycerate mutase [Phycisphaerae bacterium]|nr:2,3-bisphosphoglycerate-independent phosphoglycerate mutase [Phycisphaerae bacterium]